MDKKTTIAILIVISSIMLALCAHRATGQTSGPIMFRIVEQDAQEWTVQLERDTLWRRRNIPLALFGGGIEFLNTPVTKFVIMPLGGGGLIGGPLTEVADWIDDLVIADSLIDNFDDGDFSDWFSDIALNGSYMDVVPDTETPNASPHCMKLVHGNTMGQPFAGRIEKRFSGLNLSVNDTIRFWLRGMSYPLTGMRVADDVPATFALSQNCPNPFNPATTINYQLATNSHVTLKVFDILGCVVATLADEVQEAGYRSVQWDASGIASGVYVYRLQAAAFVEAKKLVVLR